MGTIYKMGTLAKNGLIMCHLVEQEVLRLRSLSMLNHENPGDRRRSFLIIAGY